jgi:phosphoadenosine phosphosulfate reductase
MQTTRAGSVQSSRSLIPSRIATLFHAACLHKADSRLHNRVRNGKPGAMRIGQSEVDAWNAALHGKNAAEIMAFFHGACADRVAVLSSMQRAGGVLCHIADRARLRMDVLFVDTGVLHRETLDARDQLASTHPHLSVKTLEPGRTFDQQIAAEGLLYLSKEGQERCCALRKDEPLRAMRGKYDVLFSALRREEGGKRGAIPIVALDAELDALRVHPLVDWSKAALEQYATDHEGVVVHKLHAWGFPTIGCFPCTTPVRPDESERAGRWRHLADVAYCGINPTDRAEAAPPSIEVSDRIAKLIDPSSLAQSSSRD